MEVSGDKKLQDIAGCDKQRSVLRRELQGKEGPVFQVDPWEAPSLRTVEADAKGGGGKKLEGLTINGGAICSAPTLSLASLLSAQGKEKYKSLSSK